LIVIPNQNLFRVANEKTTFTDAFAMADQVLYSGVACITDLMVKEGLINLDFADVRAVMRDMGKAMMGTGEATGERRAITAAEAAIANPLLDETSMKGAKGLLISITGGSDLTLFEVDEAATRIREEVDPDANIILGATFDSSLDGTIRVSVVATGIDIGQESASAQPAATPMAEISARLRQSAQRMAPPAQPAPASAAPVAEAQPQPAPVAMEQLPVEQAPPLVTETEVVLQPVAARPALFREAPVELDAPPAPPREEPLPAREFIPPAAERPMRPVRMPAPEELPRPAQQQLMAMRDPAPVASAPANPVEKKRVSLMDKLAAIGFTRRNEDSAEAPPAPRQAAPVAPPRPAPQVQRAAPPAPQMRRDPAGLDVHGRPVQPAARAEEDHLDIPAFLRRQAN
ncbi:MAG: cell division protein FtsZ, partial [Phreatobacter sp.]